MKFFSRNSQICAFILFGLTLFCENSQANNYGKECWADVSNRGSPDYTVNTECYATLSDAAQVVATRASGTSYGPAPGDYNTSTYTLGGGCTDNSNLTINVNDYSGTLRDGTYYSIGQYPSYCMATLHEVGQAQVALGQLVPYITTWNRTSAVNIGWAIKLASCGQNQMMGSDTNGCIDVVDHFISSTPPRSCGFGDPIYPLTGQTRQPIETGISVADLPLTIMFDNGRKITGNAAGDSPGFGHLWFSSMHRNLSISSLTNAVQAYRGDGTVISFAFSQGVYSADAGSNTLLTKVAGTGYNLYDKTAGRIENYDVAGKLQTMHGIGGQRLSFVYSDSSTSPQVAPAPGYLLQVVDSSQRSINFEYVLPIGGNSAVDAQISKITTPIGREILIGYDAALNLKTITWEDGHVRTFMYENVGLPWALTGVVDENNARYSTFAYDGNGLAISTELSGGMNRFGVTYLNPPVPTARTQYDVLNHVVHNFHEWIAPAGVAVVAPNGTISTVTSQNVSGVPAFAGSSVPAGSGCLASTSSKIYDANGNVVSSTKFDSSKSCKSYDSQNRISVWVEGLSPSADCTAYLPGSATIPVGARKGLSEWHPIWRLPTRETTSGLISTYVYNGQPDPFAGGSIANCSPSTMLDGTVTPLLCKHVKQATNPAGTVDTTVQAKTRSFTYDSSGKLITATDPNNHSTVYSYYSATSFSGVGADALGYTIGDLQSITNPAGKSTIFNDYRKDGRVHSVTDQKNITTIVAHTLRGNISSIVNTAPSGQSYANSYTYDGVGQMVSVVLEDGASFAFSYDGAHRLIGVTDPKGNTVAYTLDNAGNRIAEQIKDPSGTLQRSITRSFDALNRLQQVTGAAK